MKAQRRRLSQFLARVSGHIQVSVQRKSVDESTTPALRLELFGRQGDGKQRRLGRLGLGPQLRVVFIGSAVIVGVEQGKDSSSNASKQRRDVLVRRRRQTMQAQRALFVLGKDAIWQPAMCVGRQLQDAVSLPESVREPARQVLVKQPRDERANEGASDPGRGATKLEGSGVGRARLLSQERRLNLPASAQDVQRAVPSDHR